MFFLLLLAPLVDFEFSDGKKLTNYFQSAVRFTNLYEFDTKPHGLATQGESGHKHNPRTLKDIMRFFGIISYSGCPGGLNGSINRRYERMAKISTGVPGCGHFICLTRYPETCNFEYKTAVY